MGLISTSRLRYDGTGVRVFLFQSAQQLVRAVREGTLVPRFSTAAPEGSSIADLLEMAKPNPQRSPRFSKNGGRFSFFK